MEKKIFTGQKNFFYNSDKLFIEYDDVIKIPQFMLTCGIDKDVIPGIDEVMDLSVISGYSEEALYEWYITRNYKNIYMNFDFYQEISPDEKKKYCDELLANHLATSKIFYDNRLELNFSAVLKTMLTHKSLVHGIIIYSEYENDFLKEDIETNYPGAHMRFGDIRKALEDVPNDSTFVFSDAEYVNVLEEMGKLDRSSIILPDLYRYNYTIDTGVEKINYSELLEKYVFKVDFFSPIS